MKKLESYTKNTKSDCVSEKLINNYFFFAYLLYLNFLNESITL